MKLADYLAEIAEIEARAVDGKITHNDTIVLRQAVTAFARAGKPTSGPVFEAFQAACGAVDAAVVKALEVAVEEGQRRRLIDKLREEADALDSELVRSAAITARQARAARARARYEHGAEVGA